MPDHNHNHAGCDRTAARRAARYTRTTREPPYTTQTGPGRYGTAGHPRKHNLDHYTTPTTTAGDDHNNPPAPQVAPRIRITITRLPPNQKKYRPTSVAHIGAPDYLNGTELEEAYPHPSNPNGYGIGVAIRFTLSNGRGIWCRTYGCITTSSFSYSIPTRDLTVEKSVCWWHPTPGWRVERPTGRSSIFDPPINEYENCELEFQFTDID